MESGGGGCSEAEILGHRFKLSSDDNNGIFEILKFIFNKGFSCYKKYGEVSLSLVINQIVE